MQKCQQSSSVLRRKKRIKTKTFHLIKIISERQPQTKRILSYNSTDQVNSQIHGNMKKKDKALNYFSENRNGKKKKRKKGNEYFFHLGKE